MVSLVVSREWETPIAIAVVVLLNATIGYVQESRAEASLEARDLQQHRQRHPVPSLDGVRVRPDVPGRVRDRRRRRSTAHRIADPVR